MHKTAGLLFIVAMAAFSVVPAIAAPDAPAEQLRDVAAIDAAIASPDRPKADLERDATAKPREVLAFLGVMPGMRVADMFSAGGYYTELLARVVGVKGQVVAYNNPPYAKFAEKGIAARYADNRLGNVRQVTAEIDELQLPPDSLDAAVFIMSFHDTYWRPADGTWNRTDTAEMLKRAEGRAEAGWRGRRAGSRGESGRRHGQGRGPGASHRSGRRTRDVRTCRVRVRSRERSAGAPGR